MAKSKSPQLQTPFQNAIVFQSGKGNKSGVKMTKGSGSGSENRGK